MGHEHGNPINAQIFNLLKYSIWFHIFNSSVNKDLSCLERSTEECNMYTVVHKKRGSLYLTVTLVNHFCKFFVIVIEEILHATVVKFMTLP